MTALLLSPSQRAQIEREARAAYPRECCGLLEGLREGDAIRIAALHPARNLSSDKDRFEIAPADHFAALRAARAKGRAIVGCYHAHPNGKSEPSARDAEGALEQLMEMLRRDRQFEDGLPRKALIDAFRVIEDDDLVGRYRRQMSALLLS